MTVMVSEGSALTLSAQNGEARTAATPHVRRFSADWLYAPTEPTERHTMPRPTKGVERNERAERLPKPHEVRLSRHAVERYASRARCELRPALAEGELRRKLADARIEWLPPAWASIAIGGVSRNVAYAVLDERICLPLRADRHSEAYVAMTCLVRGFADDAWLQTTGGRAVWDEHRLAAEVVR